MPRLFSRAGIEEQRKAGLVFLVKSCCFRKDGGVRACLAERFETIQFREGKRQTDGGEGRGMCRVSNGCGIDLDAAGNKVVGDGVAELQFPRCSYFRAADV